MPRSHFSSHHMPIMLLFLPLQQWENSEGGPPCNSMPLVWLGLTICIIKSSYYLVRHRIYKLTLLFCLGSSRQSLKVREVKCIPGDPATTCPVLFKGSCSPAVIGLVLHNLLYVPSLSCKAVLSVMVAVLCCVCGYGNVCPSFSICGPIFIYYRWVLHLYGCMRTLRV